MATELAGESLPLNEPEALLHPRPIALQFKHRQDQQDFMPGSEVYTTPSAKNEKKPNKFHYPHKYLWDLCFAAKTFAMHGYMREAVQDITALLAGQREDGMIPGTQYAPRGRKWDPERRFCMEPDIALDYSQPPIVAETELLIFDEFVANDSEEEGIDFLETVYSPTRNFYMYFDKHRRTSSDNPLIANIHPHETGRDSDPLFNFAKWKIPRNGRETNQLIDWANTGLDYLGALAINAKNRLRNWEPHRIREVFWFNDVMYNTMYAKNLRSLSKMADILGKTDDAEIFKTKADEIENAIIDLMWDGDARDGKGMFYGIDASEKKPEKISPGVAVIRASQNQTIITTESNEPRHIKEISISSLFPLQLENLPTRQLYSILTLMDEEFDTPFVLPTIGTSSPNHDPHYSQFIMWQGTVWIWINRENIDSLVMQAGRDDLEDLPELGISAVEIKQRLIDWAKRIEESSDALTEEEYGEFYDPYTGQPYRNTTFAGSAYSPPKSRIKQQ